MIAEKEGVIAEKEGVIAEKEDCINEMLEERSRKIEEVVGLTLELSEIKNHLSHKEQDLHHIKAYLDLVKSSWSWRLTSPFRRFEKITKSIIRDLKRYRLAAWIIWLHRKTGIFNPRWYLQNNDDVKQSGINPWLHFSLYGVYEGRAPSEKVDLDSYTHHNQDVANAFSAPMLHYVLMGYLENRTWKNPKDGTHSKKNGEKLPRSLSRLSRSPLERLQIHSRKQWPLISVVMPTYNAPVIFLNRAIESVLKQTYSNWELCIVDDGTSNQDVHALLTMHANSDHRIKVLFGEKNNGISKATNEGISIASGEFTAFLDHDDELTEDALAEVSCALLENTTVDVIYTDQNKIDKNGSCFEPFHKPAWSPIYLLGVMYIGHLLVVRTELLRKIGGCDASFDKIQDFELMLRLSEMNVKVIHIPKILYHWRTLPGSIAASTSAKGSIERLQTKAVQESLDRLRLPVTAKAHRKHPHRIQLFSKLQNDPRIVSIIIPTKDAPEHLQRCLETIFTITKGCNFEVIVADTGTTDPDAIATMNTYPIKRIDCPGVFNFSRANNIAARHAKGEFLLFLNNDTEIVDPQWLLTLLAHHSLPNVGAVGPILIYPNGSVQHAGVAIGARGTADHIMRHGSPEWDGYAGSLPCAREVSAVTAACMMMPRELFWALGGFNEDYARHYQDTDLCLRIREEGRSILHVGNVILKHHESVSRGGTYDMVDRFIFQDRWSTILDEGDPFYNPNLSLEGLDYCSR